MSWWLIQIVSYHINVDKFVSKYVSVIYISHSSWKWCKIKKKNIFPILSRHHLTRIIDIDLTLLSVILIKILQNDKQYQSRFS